MKVAASFEIRFSTAIRKTYHVFVHNKWYFSLELFLHLKLLKSLFSLMIWDHNFFKKIHGIEHSAVLCSITCETMKTLSLDKKGRKKLSWWPEYVFAIRIPTDINRIFLRCSPLDRFMSSGLNLKMIFCLSPYKS